MGGSLLRSVWGREGPSEGPGEAGRGRNAPLDVREGSVGPSVGPGGFQEGLPEVWEGSVRAPGGLGGVCKGPRRSRRGCKAPPEFLVWSGGPPEVPEGSGGPLRSPGGVGRGRKAPPEFLVWSGGPPGRFGSGWEVPPEVREESGGPPEVWEGLGGPTGGLGVVWGSPEGPEGVGRPPRRCERVRKVPPEVRERSGVPPEGA